MSRVNRDEKIHAYLDHYPFTSKGAAISLSFLDARGKEIQKNVVAHTFTTNDGYVCYSYYDHEKQRLQSLYKEPYEDALRIVKEQGRLERSQE